MSNNMGQRTASSQYNMISIVRGYESPGLPVPTVCRACGKPKKPGKSHSNKCSRKMQRMHQRGEI